MNEKPEYLYHGSQYYFDTLEPQQARGQCERESMLAIYAAEKFQEVIPFALPIRWYPDSPEGKRDFTCDGGRTKLLYGSLDPDGIGYIYKVKSVFLKKLMNGNGFLTERVFRWRLRKSGCAIICTP